MAGCLKHAVELEICEEIKHHHCQICHNHTVILFPDGNFCDPDPCPSNSYCIRKPFDYECVCMEGYTRSIDQSCVFGKYCCI